VVLNDEACCHIPCTFILKLPGFLVVLNLFLFSQNDPDTLPTELLHHDSYDSCSKDIADDEDDYKIWKKHYGG